MSRLFVLPLAAAVLLASHAADAEAQWRVDRFAQPTVVGTPSLSDGWNPLAVAKWTTAALAVGAGVYGFIVQADASDDYDALEQFCRDEPDRCRDIAADGGYADIELERRYAQIVADYRTARWLLIGSQVALVGSIALFVLDLGDDSPSNIPYEPERLDFGVGADGSVWLGARYPVSNIWTRSP